MNRRGFLSFMGGAVIATPAIAKTASGVLLPVPQQIIGERLVIEDMVLRGITIRNCHIVGDGKMHGLEVYGCVFSDCGTGVSFDPRMRIGD